MMLRRRAILFLPFLTASLIAAPAKPTVEDAKAFVEKTEAQLLALNVDSSRADWVRSTYITSDTETLARRQSPRKCNWSRTPRALMG